MLPKWAARVAKDRAQDLREGEQVVAATYFQGRGSAAGQVMFGAVSGTVGGLIANRLAHNQGSRHIERSRTGFHRPEGSIAAALPDHVGVLAITDQRLLGFGYKQGAFRTAILDPVVDIPIERLVGWSFSPGKLTAVLNLAFDDGSDTGVEIPRVNKPNEFAEALGIPSST